MEKEGKARKMAKIDYVRKVMFVCGGNTCRSPMAQYLFKHLCGKRGLDIEVISRASLDIALPETPRQAPKYRMKHFIMAEAEEALLDYDPDIRGIEFHVPMNWTAEDIETSDLVLTMECQIRDKALGFHWIKGQDLERKVYTLKEYAGFFDNPEIVDPIILEHIDQDLLMANVSFEDLYIKGQNGELMLNPAKQKQFREGIFQAAYNISRDDILRCLHIMLDGKEARHEEILKNRISGVEALVRRYRKNGR